jgi:translocation and assembly module TamA
MHRPRPVARLSLVCLSLWLLPWAVGRAAVEIEGVRGALRDNVLAHLELDDAPCDAPSWRVRRLNRKAEREIREALEAYGYYDPAITVDSGSEDGCWLSTITIAPGEPVRLRRVDVALTGEGGSDAAFARLLGTRPLQQGAVLNHAVYERFKKSITDLARERGYFAGEFVVSRIEVRTRENVADVTLHYNSGPRYRFGPVTFEQAVVRPSLVERFVDFEPGEPYDGVVVNDFYNALLATGYFSTVDLRTNPGEPPDLDVPVHVVLTAAKRKVYTAGAGYSTDAGLKLRAGYTNRLVNERGHQFDASGSWSDILTEIGVSYRLPRRDPRVEWLTLETGFQDEDTTTRESQIYKIGVKEYHRRRNDWIETWLLDASWEESQIADEQQRQFLLIPGISWSHTFPNNSTITRPDSGHRLNVKLSGTTEYIGSDSNFVQAEAYGKLILPVWSGARLLLKAELGATVKDEFRTLPASVRFFAGGDYSVRGYDYESLGPTDEEGNVVGGSHKLVVGMELDQRVWRNWSAAVFVDSGNAFDTFANLRTKTGVGGGIRWYSPLGPVRVDVAFPLDKDAPDDWRIHVTLGPDL